MNWKELFARYDELKGLSSEELDRLLGKHWSTIFQSYSDEDLSWLSKKENEDEKKVSCSNDSCRIQ